MGVAAGRWWTGALPALMSACLVVNEDFDDDQGLSSGAAAQSTGMTLGTTATPTTGGAATALVSAGGTGGSSVGSSGAEACGPDGFESNDQEDAAAPLMEITFTSPLLQVDAVAEENSSSDWYRVHLVADTADVIGLPTTTVSGGLEVCMYMLCDSGLVGTDVDCDGNAIAASSPVQGLLGCCSVGDGITPIQYDCSTPDLSATAFIRVTGPAEVSDDTCDYQLTFDVT